MVAPSAATSARFLTAPPSSVRGFLFYGTDSLQISSRTQRLVDTLSQRVGPEAEIVRLHDSDLSADPDLIVVELATGSLFGGTKIIWLSSVPAKAHPQLLQAVDKPFESAYIAVQASDMKRSHRLVQAFEAAPYLAAIGCYGSDRDSLSVAIRQLASSRGYEITSEAALLVAVRCDFSDLLARSEMEKLFTFLGEKRQINADDVEACLVDQQTVGITQIIDAAMEGETRKALLSFEQFMASEQNVNSVLFVLSLTLLRLHMLRTAADRGTPIPQAIKELRPPVFFKQHDRLAEQVRSWTTAHLSSALSQVNEVLKETRLKADLSEALAADLIMKVAMLAQDAAGRKQTARSQ